MTKKPQRNIPPSKIPVAPEPAPVKNVVESEGVDIEGPSHLVDDLLETLQSVATLKADKTKFEQVATGLKKIVEEQNKELKELRQENAQLKDSAGLSVADEKRLFAIFGEISFDRKSGDGSLVVRISGRRSHRYKASGPTLKECLIDLRKRVKAPE